MPYTPFVVVCLATLFFAACDDGGASPAGPQTSSDSHEDNSASCSSVEQPSSSDIAISSGVDSIESIKFSSSSNEIIVSSSDLSSSSIMPKSSSSVKSGSSAKSSSSLGECTEKCVYRFFFWDGSDDTYGRVETGSPEKTSGLWRTFDDSEYGGTSRIEFPSDVEADEDGNFFGPLVETYGGIKGSVSLGDGYEFPYAGIEFDVWSANKEGVDISDWGGLCLQYSSTVGFRIELIVENDSSVTEYNNYKASFDKVSSISTVCVRWEKFKQDAGWGKSVPREEVLRKTSTIRLNFSWSPGVSGDFYIRKIGCYGCL